MGQSVAEGGCKSNRDAIAGLQPIGGGLCTCMHYIRCTKPSSFGVNKSTKRASKNAPPGQTISPHLNSDHPALGGGGSSNVAKLLKLGVATLSAP